MNQKELKRLSRTDLLEMMLDLSKENEHLRKELHQVKARLEDRTIAVEQSGSLAEAAMNLNGVFQAAQAACEQYSMNIRAQADALLAQAREKQEGADARAGEILARSNAQADRILAQARAQAKQILDEAGEKAKQILDEAEQERARREEKYAWITNLMENGEEA